MKNWVGHLPSWDPNVAKDICDAIRSEAPEILINMSTGVLGPDISAPVACLESARPEMAALNAGSLNYLRTRTDGSWAWDPILFDNPVEKIQAFLQKMQQLGVLPECECFDTGIVRSLRMFQANGLLGKQPMASFVMGVASGMAADPEWLPLLVRELPEDTHWQVIGIGRSEVWPLLERAVELGGDIRTGLEDTFYLPDGKKAKSNGILVEAAAKLIRSKGREVATPKDVRESLNINPA